MCNDGIDKTRQQDGVTEIGDHLATFRQGSRHNRGGGCAKGVLEHPKGVVIDAHQKEVGGPDEPIGIAAHAERKGISNREVGDGGSALPCYRKAKTETHTTQR